MSRWILTSLIAILLLLVIAVRLRAEPDDRSDPAAVVQGWFDSRQAGDAQRMMTYIDPRYIEVQAARLHITVREFFEEQLFEFQKDALDSFSFEDLRVKSWEPEDGGYRLATVKFTRKEDGLDIETEETLHCYRRKGDWYISPRFLPQPEAAPEPIVIGQEWQAQVKENETLAVKRLRQMLLLEISFSLEALQDRDGDHTGEFGSIEQLAVAYPEVIQFKEQEAWQVDGYCYWVLVPPTTDEAEAHVCLVAWPVELGRSGARVFILTETETVYTHANSDLQFSGQTSLKEVADPGWVFKDGGFTREHFHPAFRLLSTQE